MSPSKPVTILDGGMGRQLSRLGAPFRLPEWSALALIEAPQFVTLAHDAFITSGAQVITTNSYGIAPGRIGEDRFSRDGVRLADLAGRLARGAADFATHRVRVAGSLPPVFESYRPDLFDAGRARPLLESLASGLAPYIDLWLIETQSSTAEATEAMRVAASQAAVPLWVSFTLRDEVGRDSPPQLRSGEPVRRAVDCAASLGAEAVLFNCSQPEVMDAAVRDAQRAISDTGRDTLQIGVYANAFMPEPESPEPYAGISVMREDLGPGPYLDFAERWVRSGATIVGGCCGIGPEHIAALRSRFA